MQQKTYSAGSRRPQRFGGQNPRKSPSVLQPPKMCHFCVNQINSIDYKDVAMLQKYVSGYARIIPKRRSGLCSKHQRKVARAIKRARIMAILPFVRE